MMLLITISTLSIIICLFIILPLFKKNNINNKIISNEITNEKQRIITVYKNLNIENNINNQQLNWRLYYELKNIKFITTKNKSLKFIALFFLLIFNLSAIITWYAISGKYVIEWKTLESARNNEIMKFIQTGEVYSNLDRFSCLLTQQKINRNDRHQLEHLAQCYAQQHSNNSREIYRYLYLKYQDNAELALNYIQEYFFASPEHAFNNEIENILLKLNYKNPQHFMINMMLAIGYLQSEQLQRAILYWEKLMTITPKDHYLYKMIADTLKNLQMEINKNEEL